MRETTQLLSELRRDGRGWILLFVSAGWFLALGVRIVYPALLPQITAEFGVGYATTGVFVGILWTTYALLQFPGGVLADYSGERAVLVLSMAITTVAVVSIFLSDTLILFVVATMLLGLGTGLYGTTRLTVISSAYPELDTTAISISQAAGNVGNVVLPASAGVISVYLGWRFGFGYLLPLLIVTAIGLFVFTPVRVSEKADANSFIETMGTVKNEITDSTVVAVTGLLFLTMFTYQSVTGFLPTYLVEMKGIAPSVAAALYSLFFAAAIVIQFISGIVADRFGKPVAIAVFIGASVPGFLLLTLLSGIYSLIGVVILLSFVLGGFPPANAYAVSVLPDEIQGSGFGLLRTFYIAFGALGPVSVGFLADRGLFDGAFVMLAAIAVLICLISLILLPTAE